ncbi:hypothetical protein POM88_007998 [Heracleum sosnowskyi]|uniref:Uncharacterized protein n=1 Tax=Heracleum sosnowskyi TaxID=360622 RepID=A0AAD8J5E9_9APIA|nr:hypothetical protein POM88_007998 [Heracleum sosnowskyi]
MFVSDYFSDKVLTKANRVSRNDDGGNVELNGRLSVFGLPGRAYGKGKRVFLSEKELHAAHNYILINCEEIDEFVRMYDDELKDKALMEGSTIPANVQALAMRPDMDQISRNSYKVNGYEFHTKAYGRGKRTTNSGMCVLGDCYNELSHAFYGELEKILELSYKDGEDEPDEIDPALILVSDDIIDTEDEELLIDTDSESESEADDGYESIQDDSDSETDT